MAEFFRECIAGIDLEALHEELETRFTDQLTKQPKRYAGLDKVTSTDYRKNYRRFLEAVQRQILSPSKKQDEQGRPRTLSRFTFSPFQKFEVLKKPGLPDKRPLCKATIKSIIAQKMIMKFLEPQLEAMFLENSYAYQRKKDGKQAIRQVQACLKQGYKHVLDADISKFFDNVDHDILLYQLKHYFPGEETLHLLLKRFLKTGYVDVEKHKKLRKIRGAGVYEPRTLGIPQGGILSGALANVYLHALDCFIRERFPQAVYVRYADDFIFFAKTQAEVLEAKEAICTYLDRVLKLKMHHVKTHVRDLSVRKRPESEPFVDFLGYRVSETAIKIQPKNLKAFQTKMREVIEEWTKGRQGLSSLISRVNSRMKGRLYDYSLGEGYSFIGNNWTSYFSLVSNPGQLRSIDAWISGQILKAVRKRTGVSLSRQHLKGRKLKTLAWLHYKMKKEVAQRAKRFKLLPKQLSLSPQDHILK
jgi:RNA-directed DNA polymerase